MDLKIKESRLSKGMTQTELAEIIGVTDRTIKKYESGDILPPLDKIQKISNALDVSIDKILNNENNTPTSLTPLLTPSENNYIVKLKALYGLIEQVETGGLFDEENINCKIVSTGINNFKTILNNTDLNLIVDSLILIDTFKNYLESNEIKNGPFFKMLLSNIKDFKHFDINGDIENKL